MVYRSNNVNIDNLKLWSWRTLVVILFGILTWNGQRIVSKVDALECGTVERYEYNKKMEQIDSVISRKVDISDIENLKESVSCINETLNRELPRISEFMGKSNEYMRTH